MSALQTALHLAVIYKSVPSIKSLLRSGASYSARDSEGRTPLHLAACDDCLPAARALLDHVRSIDVDDVDIHGFTALQIACSGQIRENTVEMVKMLLEKNADPMKGNSLSQPAWKLARDKGEVMKVMEPYLPGQLDPTYYDLSTSDEYESAEENNSDDSNEISEICTKMEELDPSSSR